MELIAGRKALNNRTTSGPGITNVWFGVLRSRSMRKKTSPRKESSALQAPGLVCCVELWNYLGRRGTQWQNHDIGKTKTHFGCRLKRLFDVVSLRKPNFGVGNAIIVGGEKETQSIWREFN